MSRFVRPIVAVGGRAANAPRGLGIGPSGDCSYHQLESPWLMARKHNAAWTVLSALDVCPAQVALNDPTKSQSNNAHSAEANHAFPKVSRYEVRNV